MAHAITLSFCRRSLGALVVGVVVGLSGTVAGAGVDPAPCNPADVAEPFGVLDLSDIGVFVLAFVQQAPAADLNQDGIFDLNDINLFVASFKEGCPPIDLCFPDIRTTVMDADLDPAPIQQNYDAVNRTIHLFGPLPFGQLMTSSVGELMPFFNDRLGTLNQCVPGNDVDPAQIALILDQLSVVAGPMPIGQMLVFDPGMDPAIRALLGELRDLGIGVPDEPTDPTQVLQRQAALALLIADAGSVRVADLFFKAHNMVPPVEMVALMEGKNSGLLASRWCDNDRCCDQGGGDPDHITDACLRESHWCNLPPPDRAFCSIASDPCR